MSARDLNPVTKAALASDVVYMAFIIRLDILGDPVLIWTGTRDYKPVGTGDAALDGLTFEGMGAIGKIGNIVDGRGGSQAVKLTLSGIDISSPLLRQVVGDNRTWQFRQAWIWIATLNADYEVIGVPFRVKTGRMDQMPVGKSGRKGDYVSVTIESHQAYASDVLNTKYSEQKDIDPTDTSQNYVHDLANKPAVIGGASASSPAGSALAGSAGRPRNYSSVNNLL